MDNHIKNVEKASTGGKFNPTFGLASSGIACTGADKDDEDATTAAGGNADEEMKDISKKEGNSIIMTKTLFRLNKISLYDFYKFVL